MNWYLFYIYPYPSASRLFPKKILEGLGAGFAIFAKKTPRLGVGLERGV
jgi:hypothetical protein